MKKNSFYIAIIVCLTLYQNAYAVTLDESYKASLKKAYLVEKANQEAEVYTNLAKSLNRFINLSYSIKNQFPDNTNEYILSNQIDIFNFNQIKLNAYDMYYKANKSLTFQKKKELMIAIIDEYFGFLLNKQLYEISLENVKDSDLLLKSIIKMKDNGKSSYVDTIIAKAFFNTIVAKSKTYFEQLKNSKNNFKELTLLEAEPDNFFTNKYKKEEEYLKNYINSDFNIQSNTFTNKAIQFDSEYDLKNSIFSSSTSLDILTTNQIGTTQTDITGKLQLNPPFAIKANLGITFSGNYNPNYVYQVEAKQNTIEANNEQINQFIMDDKMYIDKIYHNILQLEQNFLLLEENNKLLLDVVKRLEDGYKVRYISLIDLTQAKNQYITNLYSLVETKVNLTKNIVLLEKITKRDLYEN